MVLLTLQVQDGGESRAVGGNGGPVGESRKLVLESTNSGVVVVHRYRRSCQRVAASELFGAEGGIVEVQFDDSISEPASHAMTVEIGVPASSHVLNVNAIAPPSPGEAYLYSTITEFGRLRRLAPVSPASDRHYRPARMDCQRSPLALAPCGGARRRRKVLHQPAMSRTKIWKLVQIR